MKPFDLGAVGVHRPTRGADRAIERYDAPSQALVALGNAAARGEALPRDHAIDLYVDGLIDADFALTPRGRRFLEAWRIANEGPNARL